MIMQKECVLAHMQPICIHIISLQSSKPSHSYPIIRLPRKFNELVGSQAEIYQTCYEDEIAFLIKAVDRSKKKLTKGSEGFGRLSQHWEPSHGGGPEFESPRAHRSFCNRGH
jgi:hypothetical protein